MAKVGKRLNEAFGFTAEQLEQLRNLSVTTAEEFVGVATATPALLAELLDVDSETLKTYTETVSAAIPEHWRTLTQEQENYPFRTGFKP